MLTNFVASSHVAASLPLLLYLKNIVVTIDAKFSRLSQELIHAPITLGQKYFDPNPIKTKATEMRRRVVPFRRKMMDH